MEIIDISLPLSEETPTYKGRQEKKPRLERIRTLAEGANETRLTLETHTGTHVDAPLHMLPASSIDQLPLSSFLGPALVIEIRGVEAIAPEHLSPFQQFLSPRQFLIVKTDNSFSDFSRENFVYLSASGASYLAQQGIKGIGIDSLGIERDQPGHPTHRLLLEKGILIFEGLYLREVEPGFYYFLCFPLKIKGGDGSPARAILFRM
ncbi:MAG: arylformamidase [Candidatus Atribacteria bacterium]|nr:arylformamidase [Candidatus Atribacteria bacterium]